MSDDVQRSATSTEEETPQPVLEEQRLLDVVQRALRRPRRARVREDYDVQLVKLRDSLAEVHLPEDRASILEHMERLSHLSAQRAQHIEARADPDNPYFGHMRLQVEGGARRDILVGRQTHIQGGVRIVDWRNAPISRVFYQCREGDDYTMTIDARELNGEVLLRRTVSVEEGALRRVGTADETFVRARDGGWVDLAHQRPSLRGGSGAAARADSFEPQGRHQRVDKHLPEIASLLDPEQFKLITRPDTGLVVIQGSAGSGKTTVALHRVAYLVYQDAARYPSARVLVVVFNRALAAYISQVLPALGVEGVAVRTFESWSRGLRRRLFPRLPDRYSDATPAIVSRVKQHSALLPMLAEAARARRGVSPLAVFDELFTSLGWLQRGFAEHAPGVFSEAQLEEVHDWCTRMHFTRVDGGGPNLDDAPTLDEEDDALLLRLQQLTRGSLPYRKGRALRYAHLVVDEAQDFSPLELKVLLDTVKRGHPVTLAGDTAQRLDEHNSFEDWSTVLEHLERSHVKVSPLKISYRSTGPIMRAARAVLGPLAPDEPLETTREGAPVERFAFASHGEAFAFITDTLDGLLREEPRANVAVLARHPHQAEEAHRALARADLPNLRRVRDQEFVFQPGVDVTDVRQSKGLEFDYVILIDVDAGTYPETDASRHLLHVGITRAAHQCWLIHVGPPSPLLTGWLEASLG